jgi:uncharacterized protein (TIGR00255 family)
MPINSMTGHGRGEASYQGVKVTVELNSVNHRQFDLRLEVPHYLEFVEREARGLVHGCLARGSIACRCHVESNNKIAIHHLVMDNVLAGQYAQAARRAAKKLKVADDLGVNLLMGLPGVVKLVPRYDNCLKLKRAFIDALQVALRGLRAMRAREGTAITAEIRRRTALLETILHKIKCRAPLVRREHEKKLHNLLNSLAGSTAADKKVYREIVMLAERCLFAEEWDRSLTHLMQMRHLLEAKEPVGRTMEFLLQEMVREINTLGSKANDSTISNLVVRYKSELECIREQAQNVE